MIYVYDGWNLIVEFDGAGNFQAWNIYGAEADEILARWVSGVGNFSYHSDKDGNVYALMDSSGNVVEKYTYDAFGKPNIYDKYGNGRSGTAIGNRFMFQGREWYPEIGLYNFRKRFYDPTFGRFIQPDPLGFGGGDVNLFRYCGGDPVNGRDPFGLQDQNDQRKPKPPLQNVQDLQPGEATTERIIVPGTELPTYDASADNVQRDISSLDRVGAAPGEGSNHDTAPGAGGADNSGTATPAPTPNRPHRTPTNDETRASAAPWILVGGGITAFGVAIKNPYVEAVGLLIGGAAFAVFMDTYNHGDDSPTPTPTPTPGG